MTWRNKLKVKAILADAGNILFDDSDLRGAMRIYLEQTGLMRAKGLSGILDTEDTRKHLGSKRKGEYYLKKSSYGGIENSNTGRMRVSPDVFKEVYSYNRDRAMVEKGYTREMSYKDTFRELKLQNYFEGFMGWLEERKSRIKNVPFEGVLDTLNALHERGIDLIVLSDGHRTGENAKEWMESMGIKTGIKDVITSKDLGFCKPDPRFYEYALKKHGLKKEEVVFLGHDLDETNGAHALGINVIAYNYDPRESAKLDYAVKIRKFSRLAELLERA